MNDTERSLLVRIRELRRKHFGARGKATFAERLGLTLAEYEPLETRRVPDAGLLMRICEVTGEDLQWLLTGVAARGTVVISGTRGRHQALLTRLADALEEEPKLAGPVEAFVNLLLASPEPRPGEALPSPAPEDAAKGLLPILGTNALTAELGGAGTADFDAPQPMLPLDSMQRLTCALEEPGSDSDPPGGTIELLTPDGTLSSDGCYLAGPTLAASLPGAFGWLVDSDDLTPLFHAGEIAITAPPAKPDIGDPALVWDAAGETARARIWLGTQDCTVNLGRLRSHETETLPIDQCGWALKLLYRVRPAA